MKATGHVPKMLTELSTRRSWQRERSGANQDRMITGLYIDALQDWRKQLFDSRFRDEITLDGL